VLRLRRRRAGVPRASVTAAPHVHDQRRILRVLGRLHSGGRAVHIGISPDVAGDQGRGARL